MKKIILCVALLALVIVGCKKDDVNPSNSNSSSTSSFTRISKEIIYSYNNQSFNDSIYIDTAVISYTYDTKGRLVSQSYGANSVTYSYISANLISSTFSFKMNDSIQNIKLNYFLDSQGKATKMCVEGDMDTTKINYTADGYSSNSSQFGYSSGLGFIFGISSSTNSQIEVVGENIVKSNYINY